MIEASDGSHRSARLRLSALQLLKQLGKQQVLLCCAPTEARPAAFTTSMGCLLYEHNSPLCCRKVARHKLCLIELGSVARLREAGEQPDRRYGCRDSVLSIPSSRWRRDLFKQAVPLHRAFMGQAAMDAGAAHSALFQDALDSLPGGRDVSPVGLPLPGSPQALHHQQLLLHSSLFQDALSSLPLRDVRSCLPRPLCTGS